MNEDDIEALNENLRIKEVFLDSGTEGIGISEKGKVLLANRQLAKMLGFDSPDDIVGEMVSNFVAPRSKELVMENMRKNVSVPYESFSRRIDGTEFPTLTFARPTRFMDKDVRITTIRDISEFYKSRMELEESEKRYRTLFNQIPITIWDEDASDLVEYIKEIGLDKIDNLENYLNENMDIVTTALSKLKINDLNSTALEMLGVSSKRRLQNSIGQHFSEKSFKCFCKAIIAIVEKKTHFEMESEFITSNGNIIDIHVFWRVLPGFEGDYSRIINVITNITSRKQAEREKVELETRFQQMQKLESLGIFASGIAHDFDNVIKEIAGYASSVLNHMNEDSPAIAMVEEIEQISKRASDLTKQLIAYSGRSKITKEVFNLNDLITEMHDVINVLSANGITLEYSLSSTDSWIEADRAQIQQIIMNLLTNAIEAVGDEGIITIKTNHVVHESLNDETGEYIFQPAEASFYTCLEITDNGKGIEESIIKKIFDPFYSTKSEGRGLGLSVVQGIIKGHESGLIFNTKLNEG
ncbi:MAG: PAS domain-containing protein, partial [Candidatus Kariarchaeaceae archaeon]